MKKILTMLMVGAMLVALPTTVFAEENTEVENITNESTGNVLLKASKSSSYAIQFPASNDVSTSGTTITLKAKGDVDSGKQIVISEQDNATNKLVDKADKDNTVDITVTFGDAIAGSTVIDTYENTTATTDITVTHDGIVNAGQYEYSLPIKIALQDITQSKE